jgi:hypothetical protein
LAPPDALLERQPGEAAGRRRQRDDQERGAEGEQRPWRQVFDVRLEPSGAERARRARQRPSVGKQRLGESVQRPALGRT